MTDVEYTEQALDHVDGLETEVAERVLNKVDEATETDHRLEKLSGYPYYKLRVGDYRAIITWDRAPVPARRTLIGDTRTRTNDRGGAVAHA